MKLSDNVTGMLAMTVASAAFIVNDTFIKLVSADMPMGQIMFVRGLLGAVALAAIAAWLGLLGNIRQMFRGRLLVRNLLEIGATGFYLPALFHLPIAIATVIAQTAPLAVTAGAALFLSEPVGWRRWLAIIAGFVGVVIVVRPDADGLNVYALLVLGSVACVACRDLLTRKIPKSISGWSLTLSSMVALTLGGGAIGLFENWIAMRLDHLGLLALSTAFVCLGFYCIIAAMRVGDVGVSAPFRYTIIPFSIVLGALVWGEMPDGLMLLGTAIIFASGIYTFHRERVRHRRLAATPAAPVPS